MVSPNVQVITVSGPPRQRGQSHGEACRPRIDDAVRRWKADLGTMLKCDPDDYIAQLLGETRFLAAAERWTPELVEEVRGIAQGSAQSFETTFARQLGDELWWHGRYVQLGISLEPPAACSALGVARQGNVPTIIAQNLDMPRLFDGMQMLLHIRYPESGLESYVFAWVGTIAANGINNHGVALCENTVLQLDHRVDGLPVDFVSRGVLEQPSLASAVQFLRRVPHASGQNYVLGGPEGVVDLECSAHKVVEFRPRPDAARVWHTNHPLASDDTAQYQAALRKMAPEEAKLVELSSNSHARLDTVVSRLDAMPVVTVDGVKDVFRSHDSAEGPVCVHNERSFSAGSMIMELSDAPALNICFGPPCSNEYVRLTF